jgi:uridylate kinase
MKINRLLLKLSGEYLAGDKNDIFDKSILDVLSLDIAEIVKSEIEISIVVGGGNIIRGSNISSNGFSRVSGDQMGLLGTAINGLAISDGLKRVGVKNQIFSSISIDKIAESFNVNKAIENLEKKIVNIFVAGTGNPFFTTDTAACLRAVETNSDIVLKATKVNGVYSDDPISNPKAKHYSKITYDEVVSKELRVMDLTAVLICKENKMPLKIFDLSQSEALIQAAHGEEIGTIIY